MTGLKEASSLKTMSILYRTNHSGDVLVTLGVPQSALWTEEDGPVDVNNGALGESICSETWRVEEKSPKTSMMDTESCAYRSGALSIEMERKRRREGRISESSEAVLVAILALAVR